MCLSIIHAILYIKPLTNFTTMDSQKTLPMQSEIPEDIRRVKHLAHSELLFKVNKRELQEKLFQIYNIDIIISANFNTTHPMRVLYWISDLTSVYHTQAVDWIELGDNFMSRVKEVAEKNIEKLYIKVKEREESTRRCYCCALGHIERNCANPNWRQTTLTTHNKAAPEADTFVTPQQEESTATQTARAPENKCSLCKGQPRCICCAITESPDREPIDPHPEEQA